MIRKRLCNLLTAASQRLTWRIRRCGGYRGTLGGTRRASIPGVDGGDLPGQPGPVHGLLRAARGATAEPGPGRGRSGAQGGRVRLRVRPGRAGRGDRESAGRGVVRSNHSTVWPPPALGARGCPWSARWRWSCWPASIRWRGSPRAGAWPGRAERHAGRYRRLRAGPRSLVPARRGLRLARRPAVRRRGSAVFLVSEVAEGSTGYLVLAVLTVALALPFVLAAQEQRLDPAQRPPFRLRAFLRSFLPSPAGIRTLAGPG